MFMNIIMFLIESEVGKKMVNFLSLILLKLNKKKNNNNKIKKDFNMILVVLEV